MSFLKNTRKKIRDYFFDHPRLRATLEYAFVLLCAIASSFIYAYGFKSFSAPTYFDPITGAYQSNLVTGGAGGASQLFTLLFSIFGLDLNTKIGSTTIGYLLQSSFFILINLPLAFIAFKHIGKKFAIFTMINIVFYFIFVNLIPEEACNIFYESSTVGTSIGVLERAILAGLCTGVSSTIAITAGHSTGGVDIISIYITTKNPNKAIGKISMFINFVIISLYTILERIDGGDWSFITMALYSLVYLFVTGTVVDALVIKNKKNQLQIITEDPGVADTLIQNFPHSATIAKGQGAFTKHEKTIIYIILSSFETKRAIRVIQSVDPHAFITVTKVQSLVGRFYTKPNE